MFRVCRLRFCYCMASLILCVCVLIVICLCRVLLSRFLRISFLSCRYLLLRLSCCCSLFLYCSIGCVRLISLVVFSFVYYCCVIMFRLRLCLIIRVVFVIYSCLYYACVWFRSVVSVVRFVFVNMMFL